LPGPMLVFWTSRLVLHSTQRGVETNLVKLS